MTDYKTEQSYWRLPEHPSLGYRETIERLISYKTHSTHRSRLAQLFLKNVPTLPCGKKTLKKGGKSTIDALFKHFLSSVSRESF